MMSRVIRSLTLMGLTLGLVVSGCAPAAAPPPPTPVSKPVATPETKAPAATPKPTTATKLFIAIPAKSLSNLPTMSALEKGYYKEEGLDPTFGVMKTDVAIAGLMSGAVDYSGGIGGVVRSATIAMPVRAVVYYVSKPSWYLMVKPEIKTTADLKGKTLAINTVTGTEAAMTRLILKAAGLDPEKDANIKPMGDTPVRLAALLAGSVDGSLLPPPTDAQAEVKGFNRLFFAGDVGDQPSSGLGTTLKRIKDDPDQIKRVIRGTLKGLLYTKDTKNRDDLVRLIMREFSLEKDVSEKSYDAMLKTYSPDGTATDKGLMEQIDDARALAKITKEVPISQVADFTLLKEVQKELGISR